jgi:hypothetical protein
MKSPRKKFVPILERLTPEQLAEFRRGMAALWRRFQRRMKRKRNGKMNRTMFGYEWDGLTWQSCVARKQHVCARTGKLIRKGRVCLRPVTNGKRRMERLRAEIERRLAT